MRHIHGVLLLLTLSALSLVRIASGAEEPPRKRVVVPTWDVNHELACKVSCTYAPFPGRYGHPFHNPGIHAEQKAVLKLAKEGIPLETSMCITGAGIIADN